MVYNWQDDTRLGGRTLIGASPYVYEKARGTLTLLILTALAVAISVGCGAGSPQRSSEGQQASGSAGSAERKAEDAGPSGRVSGERDGHPALGSADAPVVLTEYSDYQ
jgi:protein-disulfide isomerase